MVDPRRCGVRCSVVGPTVEATDARDSGPRSRASAPWSTSAGGDRLAVPLDVSHAGRAVRGHRLLGRPRGNRGRPLHRRVRHDRRSVGPLCRDRPGGAPVRGGGRPAPGDGRPDPRPAAALVGRGRRGLVAGCAEGRRPTGGGEPWPPPAAAPGPCRPLPPARSRWSVRAGARWREAARRRVAPGIEQAGGDKLHALGLVLGRHQWVRARPVAKGRRPFPSRWPATGRGTPGWARTPRAAIASASGPPSQLA